MVLIEIRCEDKLIQHTVEGNFTRYFTFVYLYHNTKFQKTKSKYYSS